MDHHKSLFKDHCSFNPRHHNRINRQLVETNRSKKRNERYQDTRNISLSPVRHKKEVIIPLCADDKSNVNNISEQRNPNSTRFAKIVCHGTNPEMLTKQEAFIKRFVEWKENKKKAKQLDVSKKKPFITAVHSGRQTTDLKSSTDNNKCEQNKSPKIKGRQSIYTVVPTPPRKQSNEKHTNKFPFAKKALATTVKSSFKTKNCDANSAKCAGRPMMTGITKTEAINLTKSLKKVKNTATISPKPELRKNLRPRVLKMPPPPSSERAVANPSNLQSVAVPKIMTTKNHRKIVKQNKKSPLKCDGAALGQNLKAKKHLSTLNKKSLPALSINGKKILKMLNNQPVEDMIIQTPRDFATSNPFGEFVTSTKIKNSNHILENGEEIADKKIPHKKMTTNSSAKRNIMHEKINTLQCDRNTVKENTKDCVQNVIKKYNFVRYSEALNVTTDANDDMQICESEKNHVEGEKNKSLEEESPTKFGPEERPANYLSPFVSVARGKVSLKKENEKRNSLYLQNSDDPKDFSSTSTIKKTADNFSLETRRTLEAVRYFRKQLQDEIDRLHHLCQIWEVYKNENLEKIQNASGEDMINVTIGQTRLLTSKKFMQFKGLIDRCESRATGVGAVEYDGSENTKPITSEDLEGFWSMLGLQVDNLDKRFDNLNRWKLNDWSDPDEIKQPISKKNVTKVKKPKSVATTKGKPHSALQQMMRKMQSEMRKNKKKNDDVASDEFTPPKLKPKGSENFTTPNKTIGSSNSRRLSIVVRDRKYFSPAATVISIVSPNQRTIARKSLHESPKMITNVQKFNEALDTMQSSLGLRKSVLLNEYSRRLSSNAQSRITNGGKFSSVSHAVNNKENIPSTEVISNCDDLSTKSHENSPVPTERKSILKTPGTAKSKLRNVIFNEKLRVKKFNFLINEDGSESPNMSHEEELAKNCEEAQNNDRLLILRNRKVRLRPSSEIVIPH